MAMSSSAVWFCSIDNREMETVLNLLSENDVPAVRSYVLNLGMSGIGVREEDLELATEIVTAGSKLREYALYVTAQNGGEPDRTK